MHVLAAMDWHIVWQRIFHPGNVFARALWTTIYISVISQVVGVVLGLIDQLALPIKIEPRIADMRPVSAARLHHASHASGARRFDHGELMRVRAERLMRPGHRLLQESERVAQHRPRFLLKALDEKPHADLRRDLAADMAAHAVGHYQQQRVAAVGVRDAVLVDLARTLPRFLENREAH